MGSVDINELPASDHEPGVKIDVQKSGSMTEKAVHDVHAVDLLYKILRELRKLNFHMSLLTETGELEIFED